MTDTDPGPTEDRREKPESLRLRTLSAGLTVDDLELSLIWYRDVLGFTTEETMERDGEMVGASLVAGNVHLMLSRSEGVDDRERWNGRGPRLYLSTVQDVDVLARKVTARGGALAAEPADVPWGRAFSVVDPDGYRLTFWNER